MRDCKIFNSYCFVIFLFVLLISSQKAVAQDRIRPDIPLKLDKCSFLSHDKTGAFVKKQLIDLYFIVENYRRKISPAVEFRVYMPSQVSILYGETSHTIDSLVYRGTQGVMFKIRISNEYNSDTVPFEVWMTNDNGVLTPCYRVLYTINQTEQFAHVTPITRSYLNKSTVSDFSQHDTQNTMTTRYRVMDVSKLNVRQSPSVTSKIVGLLSAGDYIEVFDIENEWASIVYKQQRAYISAKYIVSDPIRTNEDIRETQSDVIVQEPIRASVDQSADGYYEEKSSRKKNNNLWFVSTVGLGFSNLISPNAYSYGTFGMAVETGLRYHWAFLPQNMYTDVAIGFTLLGNESYRFPYFSVTLYPFELSHRIHNQKFFAQVGISLLLGGDDMNIYHSGSFIRTYDAQPCVALVVKESIELGRNWNVGLQYIRGMNNVCDNLPIGLEHSSIQAFATYKIIIK